MRQPLPRVSLPRVSHPRVSLPRIAVPRVSLAVGVTAPALIVLAALAACTPVPPPLGTPLPGPSEDPEPTASADSLFPPGYGSLHQDEFSLDITDGAVHVKVTPLAEEVVRLAAPDTYERLHALASSRRGEAARLSQSEEPALFLVSFFSREPNVEYRPEEIQISHRGRVLRPAAIVPLTTGWGRQLLQPQGTQSAIYAFEPPFDYDLPLTLRYGLLQTDEWHRSVIPRLEDERARVLSRAGSWIDQR